MREPIEAPAGIALYARVWSADQKDDLARQLERLQTYAMAKGDTVSRIGTEVASELNESRPKLTALLREGSRGVIVVEHKDRLTRCWQAEAAAHQTSRAVAVGALDATAVMSPLAAEKPCWNLNHCSEGQRGNCPACAALDVPCWMARLRADGKLPARCYGCALFRTRPALHPVTGVT